MPRRKLLLRAGALDRAAFSLVARARTPWLDRALPAASRAGDNARLWWATSALLSVGGGVAGRRAAMQGMVSLGLASAVVNLAVKRVVRRPRPLLDDVPSLRRLAAQPATTSFPSGHAASAAAFAAAASSEAPGLAMVLAPVAGAVAASRVYVGVHYPGDVAVGAGIGLGFGLGGARLLAARLRRA